MKLAEYADDYPRCHALGLLEIVDGRPLASFDRIREKLSATQQQSLACWMHGKTNPLAGYYAWNVERWLVWWEMGDSDYSEVAVHRWNR